MFSSRMWYLQVYVRGSKKFGRFTRKFLTTYFATKLFVEFVEQSTLVKEDEGSHLPNCQEILGIDTLELSLLFLAFHKHDSLPHGWKRAFISFYRRAPLTVQQMYCREQMLPLQFFTQKMVECTFISLPTFSSKSCLCSYLGTYLSWQCIASNWAISK